MHHSSLLQSQQPDWNSHHIMGLGPLGRIPGKRIYSDDGKEILITHSIGPHIESINHLMSSSAKQRCNFKGSLQWMDSKEDPKILHFIELYNFSIIAYNYFIPRKDGILLSGGSFVSPDHKGEYVLLLSEALDYLKSSGFRAVYGFANQNSYPIVKHPFMGYQESKEFRQIILYHPRAVNTENVHVSQIPFSRAVQIEGYDEYTKWRIHKPVKQYDILKVENAYAIIGKNTPNNMDVLTISGVNSLNQYFNRLKLLTQYLWAEYPNWTVSIYLNNAQLYKMISDEFKLSEFSYERHLMFKVLDKSSFNMWDIEMIDSDVF